MGLDNPAPKHPLNGFAFNKELWLETSWVRELYGPDTWAIKKSKTYDFLPLMSLELLKFVRSIIKNTRRAHGWKMRTLVLISTSEVTLRSTLDYFRSHWSRSILWWYHRCLWSCWNSSHRSLKIQDARMVAKFTRECWYQLRRLDWDQFLENFIDHVEIISLMGEASPFCSQAPTWV